MNLTQEEFDRNFRRTLDVLLEEMAVNPGVDIKKFYSMACFLENMAFFSPILYGMVNKSKK